MQSRRGKRTAKTETRRGKVSLDLTKGGSTIDLTETEEMDLKLIEAIERLERAQSKALNALGSLLSRSA